MPSPTSPSWAVFAQDEGGEELQKVLTQQDEGWVTRWKPAGQGPWESPMVSIFHGDVKPEHLAFPLYFVCWLQGWAAWLTQGALGSSSGGDICSVRLSHCIMWVHQGRRGICNQGENTACPEKVDFSKEKEKAEGFVSPDRSKQAIPEVLLYTLLELIWLSSNQPVFHSRRCFHLSDQILNCQHHFTLTQKAISFLLWKLSWLWCSAWLPLQDALRSQQTAPNVAFYHIIYQEREKPPVAWESSWAEQWCPHDVLVSWSISSQGCCPSPSTFPSSWHPCVLVFWIASKKVDLTKVNNFIIIFCLLGVREQLNKGAVWAWFLGNLPKSPYLPQVCQMTQYLSSPKSSLFTSGHVASTI